MSLTLLSFFAMSVMLGEYNVSPFFADAKWFALLGVLLFAFLGATGIEAQRLGATSAAILLFVGVATYSSLNNNGDFNEGLQRSMSFGCLYLLAFIVPTPRNPGRRIEVWTKSLLAICFVAVFASMISLPSGIAFEQGRLRGITDNANALGSLSSMLLVAAVVKCMALGRAGRKGWILTALVATTCLLLTQSRGSLAAAVAGIAVIAWVKKQRLLVSGLLFAVALAALADWTQGTLRVGQFGGRDLAIRRFTLDNRIDILRRHYEVWRQKPFVGCGLQMGERDSRSNIYRAGGQASYTDLLTAVGAVGAIPFFLGLLLSFRALMNYCISGWAARGDDASMELAVIALGIVASILVHSAVEGFMAAVGAMQPIYVWLIAGAAVELRQPQPTS